MRLNKYIKTTKAEGWGNRFAIWTQGCSIRCDGCFAKHTWDFNKGTIYSVDFIKAEISSVLSDINGITILGGEPFDQYEELGEITEYAN